VNEYGSIGPSANQWNSGFLVNRGCLFGLANSIMGNYDKGPGPVR